MLTQAKINANRRNAQKSTGPRTPSGKAIASRNAIQHGLCARTPVIPGESETEFQTYVARWLNDLNPIGPIQEFLAERLISISWRLRRVGRLEAQLFEADGGQQGGTLSKLSRYESALERSFYRNLKELRRLQEEAAEESTDSTDDTDEEEIQNEPTGVEVPQNVLITQSPAEPLITPPPGS